MHMSSDVMLQHLDEKVAKLLLRTTNWMHNRVEVLGRLVEAHEHIVIRIVFSTRCIPLNCAHVFGSEKVLLVEELELAQVLLRRVDPSQCGRLACYVVSTHRSDTNTHRQHA